MPVLAQLLTTLFGAISVFLAKLFIAKLAIRIAAVAALTVISGVLMNVFNTQVSPLVQAMFSTEYGQFLGLAFPPIAGTCIAAITTIWMACMTYTVQARAIRLTASM